MTGRHEIARTNPPRHVREAMDATERAELERLRALVDWITSTVWPAQMTDGEIADQIISRARQARGQEHHGRAD